MGNDGVVQNQSTCVDSTIHHFHANAFHDLRSVQPVTGFLVVNMHTSVCRAVIERNTTSNLRAVIVTGSIVHVL